MIVENKEIQAALSTLLPTYYELFLDKSAAIPCISYIPNDNRVDVQGDTMGYSYVSFKVKLWAKTVEDIETYSPQIDDIMREMGYVREQITELSADGVICRIMVYQGLGKEYFNEVY